MAKLIRVGVFVRREPQSREIVAEVGAKPSLTGSKPVATARSQAVLGSSRNATAGTVTSSDARTIPPAGTQRT